MGKRAEVHWRRHIGGGGLSGGTSGSGTLGLEACRAVEFWGGLLGGGASGRARAGECRAIRRARARY
jgi:hypothetical protein